VNDELLLCAHDVSEGGTVFALAEMCIAGDSGCEVDLSGALSELGSRIDAVAFGEIPGHVVVGFESDSEQALRDKLPNGLTLTVIGDSAPDSGQVKATFNGQTLVDSQTSDLKDAYESAIPGCMD
jgi:phosphoribosylformylglycinamidine synthase